MNENTRSLYAFIFIVVLGLILIQIRRTSAFSEITKNEIMGHIRYLSHENRTGRYPGTRGSKDVIAYLVKRFKSYGVQPGAGQSFIQPFNITTGIELGENNIVRVNDNVLTVGDDYMPLSFSGNGQTSALAVFAGYGFNIAEDELRWNDYEGLDVRDKWVVVLRHSPERDNQHSVYAPHSALHKKMLVARDLGAAGILFVSQLEDQELYPLKYIPGYKNAGIPAIHLSNDQAEEIFKTVGWSRQIIQETMNRSLESVAFELPNIIIESVVNINFIETRAANVIGAIRSGNRKYRDEYIVVGAHFDHIGMGGAGSGSRKPNENAVHPGADDNASGVAGLLELAQKLTSYKSRLKRSILLIGFDAEEKGLQGARHFTEHPTVDLANIITMINMDMIGRMKDSSATAGGVGTSPMFNPLLDSLSKNRGFNLNMTLPGFGPSDHAVFYAKDIPVLFFFSGFHNEYHTPDDTWKLINLQGEKDILELIYDIVFHLARTPDRPVYTEAGPKQGQMNRDTRFKVTFGIMPAYGSMKDGLEVDGVSSPDGPAARAGIKKGDVIKAINGKVIKDIYEYMDRLGKLEKGMTVPVLVDRDGAEINFNLSF